MWNHQRRASVSGTAAALVLILGATPSIAATTSTWTVHPGGDFSAMNIGHITIKDATTGTMLSSKSSSLAGKLKSGSGLPGTRIASIIKFSFSSCFGGTFATYTLTTTGFPYYVNAKSYDTVNGGASVTVTRIVGAMSGGGCNTTISGKTATTPGQIDGKYINSTHQLKIITSGSTLHFYNVSAGCLGLWNTGDSMIIYGTYAVGPAQTITSP